MNHSKNASRADNQQERLIKIGWIIGFVDGEGCFSIHLVKQPDRKESTKPNGIRKGYKTGIQVGHEFVVVQGARSLESLQELKDYFGIGDIYINRRHDNHKEDLYRYSVTRRKDLLDTVIPFFERYSLHTAKENDFIHFARCVREMEKGQHLTHEGLITIIRSAEQMNHKKPRTELIRILRNQTPNSQDLGEDRVQSA